MPDSKTKRGKPDRIRVNINEAYERAYWRKKFGVSNDQLIAAVKKVGVMAKNVARELGK